VTFRRSSPRRGARWSLLFFVVLCTTLVVGGAVLASHPEVSLTGANFEIDTDANLIVNDPAPSIDWANVDEVRQQDLPTGATDDSFGNGTKENTAVPSIVDGSIPPNKSDLLNFGVYLEENANGRFLNLFWHRVQEPNGTTNMDFEFNQSETISANGVTPVRTVGDVLIQYDLSQGGTNPQLFVSRWLASGVWGPRTNLTAAGDATGSINTSPILAANSDGLGDVSPRTFGEAQIDFDALTGGGSGTTCASFGSAYLKSRASDSFTAALKDFIAPTELDIDNCATVIIRKQTVPDEDPNATLFGFTKTFATQPTSANAFNLADDGVQSYTNNVLQGTGFVIDEATIPAGWALTNIECTNTGVTPTISVAAGTVTFDLDDGGDVLDCTYTNTLQQGAILIDKVAKHADSETGEIPHAGVTYTLTGGDLPAAGLTGQTNAQGELCFDDLTISSVAGTYTATETVPAGYHVAGNAAQSGIAVVVGDCATATSVSFENIPLTDITVTVNSQVPGGTSSDITCDWTDPAEEFTTPASGDGSLSETNLEPGTYTCEIVVDP
jgi:hypothetical protein